MFRIFQRPLEKRLVPFVWPDAEAIQVAVPSDRDVIAPVIAIQATAAIANLAIAVMNLFLNLPQERAAAIASSLEKAVFERISGDQQYYAVKSILKLGSERAVWSREMLGVDVDTMAKLDTIMRVVHSARLSKYQEECQKGLRHLLKHGNPSWSYGPLGFVAKRWLSEITGQPVLREDDLSEAGFDGVGVASFYFSSVGVAMAEQIKR
jgi:hypothetical protein